MKEVVYTRKQHFLKLVLAVVIVACVFLLKSSSLMNFAYPAASDNINYYSPFNFSSYNNINNKYTTYKKKQVLSIRHPKKPKAALATTTAKVREVTNVVFVKVHKCASSVVQNILFRFARSRKLNVLLPIRGHLINDSGTVIDWDAMVRLPEGQRFNILCNHLIFNRNEIQPFFPKSTTKYIGILRHPLQQLNSALYFYGINYSKSRYIDALKTEDPLHNFLSAPHRYDFDSPRHSFVNNRMSIDFGFPVSRSFGNDKRNLKKISKFIKDTDLIFDLILIVELFDESLVLLRRLLHWRTDDILHMKLNVSPYQQSRNFETQRASYKAYYSIDYDLYNYFRRKLEKRIADEGPDFRRELDSFRTIKEKVLEFCLTPPLDPNVSALKVEGTPWGPAFTILPKNCDLMGMGETNMVRLVRLRQLERFSNLARNP